MAIFEKVGTESIGLNQIHTGPHAGEWLVAIRYPDWTTYGKASEALAGDPAFHKFLDEVSLVSELVDRTVLVGFDL